jgi:uncharacterized protein (DUF433 family)
MTEQQTDKEGFHSDPEMMGGELVVNGTRVPVQALIDTLRAGRTLDEFLEHFPTVERAQAVEFFQQATLALVERRIEAFRRDPSRLIPAEEVFARLERDFG